MRNLNYPAKPWKDGQRANLISDIEFMYSQSLKKWVPITPGTIDNSQITEAFGVNSINELLAKFNQLEKNVINLDSDLKYNGRIWKSTDAPLKGVYDNDVWIDTDLNKMYSWNAEGEIWVEINYIG